MDDETVKLRSALSEFVATIDATGGLVRLADGDLRPVGDPQWGDLARAYRIACDALGREPCVVEDDDENEE